jgi:hypothetical protein
MIGSFGRRPFSARAIVAGVVGAIVFAALAFAAPLQERGFANSAAQDVAVSADDAVCAGAGDDSAPGDHRDHALQCCQFCKSGARKASLPVLIVVLFTANSAREPMRVGPQTGLAVARLRASGWASAWSSRAPPRV